MRKHPDVAGLPAAGMLPPTYGLQIGIVKQIVEDPQKSYRIFVYLPSVHESDQGVWCRLASFYAAGGVGALFVPEIDAEVVVGFLSGDPRFPIILGCLYSKKQATPLEVEKDNSKKTLVSKSKLELTFDDKEKAIVIQTPGGRMIYISDEKEQIEITNGKANKILLGKKDIEITSQQDITLSAQGAVNINAGNSAAVTAGNEVNISGQNVKADADMQVAVSGGTSAALKSGGTTIVKGTMVQIN